MWYISQSLTPYQTRIQILCHLSQSTAASNKAADPGSDGEYVWDTDLQAYILSSFFYGYVITQIPFGIMAKKYGSLYFLGVGMLINSVFGLLVPMAAEFGWQYLIVVRFIQGLGEVRIIGTECKVVHGQVPGPMIRLLQTHLVQLWVGMVWGWYVMYVCQLRITIYIHT